jgi:hypothetical protein
VGSRKNTLLPVRRPQPWHAVLSVCTTCAACCSTSAACVARWLQRRRLLCGGGRWGRRERVAVHARQASQTLFPPHMPT